MSRLTRQIIRFRASIFDDFLKEVKELQVVRGYLGVALGSVRVAKASLGRLERYNDDIALQSNSKYRQLLRKYGDTSEKLSSDYINRAMVVCLSSLLEVTVRDLVANIVINNPKLPIKCIDDHKLTIRDLGGRYCGDFLKLKVDVLINDIMGS